jgi:ABC-2 type transport system permease protein
VSTAAAPVAAPSPRPGRVVAAAVRRDWAIARSYRLPFALGLFESLAAVSLLHFLSRIVGPEVGSTSSGYFGFAVIGTALLTMFGAMLAAFAQRLRSDQTTGTLEVLLTMPPRARLTLMAGASYQLLFATGTAFVNVVLAVAVFGLRLRVTAEGAGVALAGLVGALAVFTAAGALLAAFVVVFKRGETLVALTSTVLMVLGGVYYPLRVLPGAVKAAAEAVPFTWVLGVLRPALLGGSVPWWQLVALALSAVVLLPLSLAVLDRAVDRARRTGTIGQY